MPVAAALGLPFVAPPSIATDSVAVIELELGAAAGLWCRNMVITSNITTINFD